MAVLDRPTPTARSFEGWIGRALPASLALLVGFGLLSLAAVLYGRWAGPPSR